MGTSREESVGGQVLPTWTVRVTGYAHHHTNKGCTAACCWFSRCFGLQKLNFFGAPLLSPEQQARMELAELDAQVMDGAHRA